MKIKSIVVGCFALLFILVFTSIILARTEGSIRLSESELYFHQEKGFTRIQLPDSRSLAQVGAPELPQKGISLVIPQDVKVEGVRILSYKKEVLEGEYYLYPTQEKVPIGYPPAPFVELDPLIYDSDSPYPGKILEVTGDGYMEGFHLVHLLVYPLEYIPKQRKLYLYNDIDFEIEYVDAKRSYFQPTRIDESTIRKVSSLVHNPEDVKPHQQKRMFAKPGLLPSDSIPYVIITTDTLKSTYEPLKQWKTRKGTKTEIKTISEIESEYAGVDLAEKIKKFIIDAKTDWNTKWVLFGGDVDSIPVRYTWDGAAKGRTIMTDHYYSCLDNTWNSDGDDKWAEVFGDTTDLEPDGVYIGRVPLNEIADVENFLDKLLSYEKDSPYTDFQTKSLVLSSFLFEENDAKRWCDTVATVVPGSFYVSGPWYQYGSTVGIDSMNQGFGIIVNCSHAQYSGNFLACYDTLIDPIDKSDIFSLTNTDKYSVMFNATCLNNKLDDDCLSKYFIKNPSGGGVGYIGTADYEWYFESRDQGKEFLSQVFSNGKTLGEAFMNSKLIFLPWANGNSTQRTRIMAYILLGDPQMEVWTETPKELTMSCNHDIIECGPDNICVHVKDEDSIDVEDALVCLMHDDGEPYQVEYTNQSGVTCFSGTFRAGSISLVASKKNRVPVELSVDVDLLYTPSDVVATPLSPEEIKITWTDNSEKETGFQILRKEEAVDPYFYPIDTVESPNVESFTDNSVECDSHYYCYKVRAIRGDTCGSGNSYPEACATTDTCPDPDPGCPYLYVWNGEGFANDNVILTGSEDESMIGISLTDFYLLSQALKPKDGKYELEIREFENEVSTVDYLSLFTIDYPLNEKIGVTPEGKLWIYSDPLSPISCVDQDGVDHLDEILAKDGKYFISNKPGYLIVDFGKLNNPGFFKPSDKMASSGGSGVEPPPKNPNCDRLFPGSGWTGNIVYVDVIGENGEWKNVAKVYPRTRPVPSLVELSQYVIANQDFKLKISWQYSYSIDQIAYYNFDDAQLTITGLQLSSVFHSLEGDIYPSLNSIDDQIALLSPDQTIKASFSALPNDPSKQRSFLLVAKGYYETLETSPSIDSLASVGTNSPSIDQNYPNPFNVATSVKFTLPDAARVTLSIYNILGQKVATLLDEEKPAGTHTVFWDGRDKSGTEVASGIYFYQLKAGDFKELKKMLLIK